MDCMFQLFCYSLSADDSTTFRMKVSGEAEHFTDLSKVSVDGQIMIFVLFGWIFWWQKQSDARQMLDLNISTAQKSSSLY